jgi:hypothetical protein
MPSAHKVYSNHKYKWWAIGRTFRVSTSPPIAILNKSSAGNSSCLITKLRDEQSMGTSYFFPQTYLHGTAHPITLYGCSKATEWAVPCKCVCGKNLLTSLAPCFHHGILWWGMSYDLRSSRLVWQQAQPFCWVKSCRILCACPTYGSPLSLMQ